MKALSNEPQLEYDHTRDLTPLYAIRWRCLDCTAYHQSAVRDCKIAKCPLWPYRMGCKPDTRPAKTPLRAIKAFCDECQGGSKYVADCPAWKECSIHRFRKGKNPKRAGLGNPSSLISKTTVQIPADRSSGGVQSAISDTKRPREAFTDHDRGTSHRGGI